MNELWIYIVCKWAIMLLYILLCVRNFKIPVDTLTNWRKGGVHVATVLFVLVSFDTRECSCCPRSTCQPCTLGCRSWVWSQSTVPHSNFAMFVREHHVQVITNFQLWAANQRLSYSSKGHKSSFAIKPAGIIVTPNNFHQAAVSVFHLVVSFATNFQLRTANQHLWISYVRTTYVHVAIWIQSANVRTLHTFCTYTYVAHCASQR